MADFKRGLSAGFGAAADLYKSQYLMNMQNRHSKTMEAVRHKYRTAERAQTGDITSEQQRVRMEAEGKRAKSASEARSKEKAAEREFDITKEESRATSAAEREHIKGAYGLKEQAMRSENKPQTYEGSGGQRYTAKDVFDMFSKLYPYGAFDDAGEEIRIEDFAKDRLGIPNFLGSGSNSTAIEEGPAAKALPAKADKGKPLSTSEKAKIKGDEARQYYLFLKKRYGDRSDDVIRARVSEKYPTWKG